MELHSNVFNKKGRSFGSSYKQGGEVTSPEPVVKVDQKLKTLSIACNASSLSSGFEIDACVPVPSAFGLGWVGQAASLAFAAVSSCKLCLTDYTQNIAFPKKYLWEILVINGSRNAWSQLSCLWSY